MKQPRVLQCIASLHEAAAGTTVYFERLVKILPGQGVKQVVMTTGTPGPAVAGHYFPLDRARFPLRAAMRPSQALARALQIEARSADIVHSHGLWLLPNVYPGQAANASGIPLVVSPHGMLAREALRFSALKKMLFWHLLQRQSVARAACWHATSPREAEDIRSFGVKAPIAIVPIGVDLPPPCSPARRRREILFLGRLHPIKGVDRLLRVWPDVAARHPDWSLRIVGPHDAAAERYRANAAAAAVPSLIFDDAVYGEEKWACYRRASLFVLPSQTENFGITVSEALAAETPVICSDGAPWGGLEDHGAGWLIEQSDDALRSALCAAIALPEAERRAMGKRGRSWIAQDFAWNVVAPQMASLYAWLAKVEPRPSFIYD